VACGASVSMLQLVAARAVQGLGAGGIIPLSMTIIGELYTLAERPRTQALFSGVWGVASVAGPLVGGYITDALSWRWVFYINLPFGLLALLVIALAYPPRQQRTRVQVDWTGAALMFSGVSFFLLAISGQTGSSLAWLVAGIVLLARFAYVERRVPEPILPVDLFRNPLIARTNTVAFLFGIAMFGAIAFIPLYVQAVLGGTATQAGQVLTPLFLGWVTTSVLAARLTATVGYKRIAIVGSVLLTLGFGGLVALTPASPRTQLLVSCLVMGAGMGCSMLSLLLAVQHGVERSRLGIATSLNQFSRSIGAAIGTAAMGALLTRALGDGQFAGGAGALGASTVALTGAARLQVAAALHQVFLAGGLTAVAALIVTFFLPDLNLSQHVTAAVGEQMLAAEMTTLEPDREPIAVPD